MALLSPNQLAGVNEKLKRADENIRNLQVEIDSFFKSSDYPTIPQVHDDRIFEALKYHRDRPIPPRFSVLAGEITHHLRSCLDHIVWEFSCDTYREEFFYKIEFPVFEDEPVDKKAAARYDGKVQGITKPEVLQLIRDYQPYKTSKPVDCPLLILHKMDVLDKHRELILCAPNAQVNIPRALWETIMRDKPEDYEITSEDLTGKLQPNFETVLQISFRNFGRRKIQAVVPGLVQLTGYVRGVVERFRALP